jgi:peptidoglycan/xylan/chitin deacetylase (PgdA/CDA1 family)
VRRTLLAFFKNPLTIVLPLMALLWFGWGHYLEAARDLNQADHNIMPGSTFDNFDENLIPDGWSVVRNGTFTYTTARTQGYVGGSAWSFTVKDYTLGSVALVSPKVTLSKDTAYLFKGFYKSTTNFDLLVRYYYQDGSSRLNFVKTYQNEGGVWTTDSLAFNSGKDIVAASFEYSLAANGQLQLDDTYLEAKPSGAYITPTPASTKNVIPNGNMSTVGEDAPVDWSPFALGKNTPSFSYKHESNDKYLQVAVRDYQNGEAKWQYKPQIVHGNQLFSFAAEYRSDVPADVVAEFTLADGKRQFETVGTVHPAQEWTRQTLQLETPATAKTMFVSLILHGNGTLDTDNYSLQDISRPGQAQFERPMVSITFDDGWRSAYQQGAAVLDEFNYKSTYYINPSVVDTDNFFTSMQIEDLRRRGFELAAHGYNHLDMTTLDDNQLKFQTEGARRYIVQKTNKSDINYASPYGKSDAEVQWYARNNYRSIRGTDSGFNTRQNFDPYNLRVLYIGNKTPLSEIQRAIEQAKADKAWLILTYHRIEEPNAKTGDSNVIVRPEMFRKQLKTIQDSGLMVKTVADALDELEPQVK